MRRLVPLLLIILISGSSAAFALGTQVPLAAFEKRLESILEDHARALPVSSCELTVRRGPNGHVIAVLDCAPQP